MLCAIYKSPRKDETYLFVPGRERFEEVPEALMESFGQPELVMVLNITADSRLAISEPGKVLEKIDQQGYYLQLPPPKENLLDTFRSENQEQEPSQ
ncbi:YcgL domain-containing protein [Saliniradius amylolyticus]|uniref:YcgL domain-containing protein HMF8227_01820 n=1 Tax=Saliniradius amylolyticus TaxID=2183582 RepID=A0A2S2E3T2_9ALTE|nr:YcgL domain-containing protein [Saliniradius amylolyticus]AWL12293.1 YcgL domain-containing protein [Saliniradius amylolyticus]